MIQSDIIIVGTGIVGLTAALALAQKKTVQIVLLDSRTYEPEKESQQDLKRVSAISLASKHIFQHLKIWDEICRQGISPYLKMQVWEELGAGQLEFNCDEVSSQALGYIIEDEVIRRSLYNALKKHAHVQFHFPVQLETLTEKSTHLELQTKQGEIFATQLLIGADGANSWVRLQMGIEVQMMDYHHTAIVATVETTLPHEKIARQRFLSTGPLAFLPLKDSYTSSIVWSTEPEEAKKLMSLDETNFKIALDEAFVQSLGVTTKISKRCAFPLLLRHAKKYVDSRIALIGDAVHTLHPLAGQGLNLGLLDAASLAEVILDAIEKERDYTTLATLRRYERWRKSDNLLMLGAVTALKEFYLQKHPLLQSLRHQGVKTLNQISFLKNFLINYAMGKRGDLPSMATSSS